MTAVTVMSAVMYKNLGLSNAEIALYTGSMYLPWVIKPLWSPVVEMFRTKRFFVLAMELVMTVTFAAGPGPGPAALAHGHDRALLAHRLRLRHPGHRGRRRLHQRR
jgi:hypothetical protein